MSNAVKLAKAAADTSVITATATQTLSNKTLAGQLIVTSNTLVANLNSDMLDGKHVGTSGSAIAALDGNNTWGGTQQINNNTTITGSSGGSILRITQTGTGNALTVEDEANPDSTPFVIDANGSVGIGTTSPTAKLDVVGSVKISQDLSVSGNVYISGNTTTLSSNNLVINDSIIYLANNNPANLNDIGFVGNFTSGVYQHTGLVRDATDGVWKLFSNVVSEPTNTVDFTSAVYDSVRVGGIITNSISVSSNTLVTNLNSDLLDGQSGSYYLNAGNLTGTINTSVLVAGTPSQNELLTYNGTANSWVNTLPQDNNNLIAMSMIF